MAQNQNRDPQNPGKGSGPQGNRTQQQQDRGQATQGGQQGGQSQRGPQEQGRSNLGKEKQMDQEHRGQARSGDPSRPPGMDDDEMDMDEDLPNLQQPGTQSGQGGQGGEGGQNRNR